MSPNAVCGSLNTASAHANAAEYFGLGVEVLHLVVEERIVEAFTQARRAGNDHHRRFFGIGPGDRVAEAQSAHAIGDADRADAVDAGVGVGGEAGAVLAGAADQSQPALFQLRVEGKDVIARNAEHVAHARLEAAG